MSTARRHRRWWRIALGGLLAAPWLAGAVVFEHRGFEQLRQGELGNAGQNLHVSRSGALQLINWLDLDRDGCADIVVNNQHNPFENTDAVIYWQHPADGFTSLLPPNVEDMGWFQRITALRASARHSTWLPALGAGHSVIADLNVDGFPDIVLVNFFHGSTHDHFPVYVYWGGEEGFTPDRRSEFPTQTGAGVAVADLDGNGFPDLVVASMGPEDAMTFAARGPRRAESSTVRLEPTAKSRIYWQGPTGFSVDNVTDLPTRFAVDVKVADMDRDGHLDLVFLQGGDAPSLRVYYGERDAYSSERTEEVEVAGRGYLDEKTGEIVIADLNADHRPDIVVAAGGPEAQVFWNRFWEGRGNLRDWPRTALPANEALSAAVGDFNRDGLADVALSGYGTSAAGGRMEHRTEACIYWGSATRALVTLPPTRLPVLGSTCVRAADINQDGFLDLAFANSADDASFDVPSYLYWGAADGFSAARREELTSFGAVTLSIADLNRDRWPDVFIGNRDSGQHESGTLNSYVYWGNPQRSFSQAVLSKIPLRGAYSCTAADFNDEGRAALAWVDAEGVLVMRFDGQRQLAGTTRIPLSFPGTTSATADLNRDGWLDLIVGGLADQGQLAVLMGAKGGFSPPRYYTPEMQLLSVSLADLGRTGRLELIAGGRGGWLRCPVEADGTLAFGRARRLTGDFQVQHVSVADLNDDGYPEVVAAQYRQMSTRRNAIDSAIYWNRGGTFDVADRTPLPTLGAHWVSIADTGGQGRLDAIFSNYHGETTRVVPLFIYSPDAKGAYGIARRQMLPALSSSSHFIADIDGNGYSDIVVMNHTGPTAYAGLTAKSGNHGVGSFVYWGEADGYSNDRRSRISSFGPHTALNAESGDILRRRSYETYTSAWWSGQVRPGDYVFTVSGTFPPRTDCRAFLQAGDTDTWLPLEVLLREDTTREYRVRVPVGMSGLRYRLELETGGAGTGPTVKAIKLAMRAAES